MSPRRSSAAARVAEAPEVDPRQHDLRMTLRDTAPDLGENSFCRAAARRAPDDRDHAEGTRERAAVLDLDECTDTIHPVLRLHAGDRTDIPGDSLGNLLASPGDDANVFRHPGERLGREIRRAPRDEDARRDSVPPGRGLPRLRDGFVRDATGVDHGDSAEPRFRCPSTRSRSGSPPGRRTTPCSRETESRRWPWVESVRSSPPGRCGATLTMSPRVRCGDDRLRARLPRLSRRRTRRRARPAPCPDGEPRLLAPMARGPEPRPRARRRSGLVRLARVLDCACWAGTGSAARC